MSTKIYNGYIARNTTITQLMSEVFNQAFRELMLGVIEQEFTEYMSRLFNSSFKQSGNGKSSYSAAVDYAREELRRADKGLRSFIDLEFILGMKEDDGDVYIGLFCSNKALKKVFDSLPEVEFYGYWNNTDPEEGVSEEQWKRRGEEWDDVLNRGNWTDSGFLFLELNKGGSFSKNLLFKGPDAVLNKDALISYREG